MTGLYNAGFFFGAFLGPLAGGALLRWVSFPVTFLVTAGLVTVMSLGVAGVQALVCRNLLTITEKKQEGEGGDTIFINPD